MNYFEEHPGLLPLNSAAYLYGCKDYVTMPNVLPALVETVRSAKHVKRLIAKHEAM
ncbi:MAG: hypothetical protein HRT36_06695 [Alphaproteobacteria bacterium]|nr:hypothetical protein [Alphaproteobacteria bacterium]